MPLWNVFESMAILYIMHGGRWVLPVGILYAHLNIKLWMQNMHDVHFAVVDLGRFVRQAGQDTV